MASAPTLLDPDETWHMPERMFLACRPDGASAGVSLELRAWSGQPVALAYSSLDRFLAGCGPDQPWVLFPRDRALEWMAEAARRAGVGGVSLLMDAQLPAELQGTAGSLAGEEPDWSDPASEGWPVVWLASRPFSRGQEEVSLELQPMPGERLAVMAYTSHAAVQAGAGEHQPAFPVPAGLVAEARRQAGAHTICLDTPLPNQLRHGPNGGSRR